ncbi:hypothetical protein [Streptomyces decoyicus]|uniref:hypothetical protein n=1 Tax=Streptomyces decoyicus TaxID=249567 RepID=UPI0006623E84|nr:hypothetical protein [Streptomyces decoyicus]KOG41257.1 hypothetical protein ADK74_22240 [Streptomyces decoyicus]QZY20165.1 hypothetical protein K7C20_37270 [Streptomyces decoyicus]
MSERRTLLRSLHDVGLAAWFGGSLMGAVGLNSAAKQEGDSWTSTARIAAAGWAKWTPVNAAAITAHLIGSSGLLAANATRVLSQKGVAAASVHEDSADRGRSDGHAYSWALGKKIELASSYDQQDLEKAAAHPVDTNNAQRQLAYMQWAVPALTGALLALNALHGEQQRPAQQLHAMWQRTRSLAPHLPWPSTGRLPLIH